MAHMSVPCHEGPPATKGHFSSEPAVAGRGRYYCTMKQTHFRTPDLTLPDIVSCSTHMPNEQRVGNKTCGKLLTNISSRTRHCVKP